MDWEKRVGGMGVLRIIGLGERNSIARVRVGYYIRSWLYDGGWLCWGRWEDGCELDEV